MKVAILGAAGRMGSMLCSLADKSETLELVAKCDVSEDYAKTWPAGTDAVVDFTMEAMAPAEAVGASAGSWKKKIEKDDDNDSGSSK